jgi:hypothetical protein
MYLFLTAGILYLIGVGIILAIKPSLMFSPDGAWKEFSISKDATHGTPFPFWLFCILWALLSYTIVLAIFTGVESQMYSSATRKNTFVAPLPQGTVADEPEGFTLPPGYYMLNKKGSRGGTPRYVYIGEEPPT